MQPLDEVVMDWGDGLTVILTVRVVPRGRHAGGPERRLAEEIAGALWAALQLSELGAAAEQ